MIIFPNDTWAAARLHMACQVFKITLSYPWARMRNLSPYFDLPNVVPDWFAGATNKTRVTATWIIKRNISKKMARLGKRFIVHGKMKNIFRTELINNQSVLNNARLLSLIAPQTYPRHT